MIDLQCDSNASYSGVFEYSSLQGSSPFILVANSIREINVLPSKNSKNQCRLCINQTLDTYDTLLVEVKRALEHKKTPPANLPPYPRPPRHPPSPTSHPPPIPPPKLSNQTPASRQMPTPPKKPLPHSHRLSQPPNDLHLINHQLASLDTALKRDKSSAPKPPNRNNYRRSAVIEDTSHLSNQRLVTRRTSPAPSSRRYNEEDTLEDIPEHTSQLRAPIVRRVSSINDCSGTNLFFRQDMDDFPTPKPRVTHRRSQDPPHLAPIQQSHSHHLLPTSAMAVRHLSHPPPPPPLMKPKPPIPRNKPILKLSHNS